MNSDRWEIRPINPKKGYRFRMCGQCTEAAEYYLVLSPTPGDKFSRESRSRLCEAHAKLKAQNMRIPFPEPSK